MTNNIKIDTGLLRITVNDDPSRVIEFNPEDVLFVERFYNLIKVFEEKEGEYTRRANEIQQGLEEEGAITGESIELIRELVAFLTEQIDLVFGAGTSKAAFGDAQTLNMFEQFFDGIVPFIQNARSKRAVKYVKKRPAKKE